MPTSIGISISVDELPVFPGGGDNPSGGFVLIEDGTERLIEDGEPLLLG